MKSDVACTVDWDPTAPEVAADSRAAYDALRRRCPVARDAKGAWWLSSHEEVRRAALDDASFSSAASRFRNVPNSMDGDEHRRFREVVDPFLAADRVAALVPMLREVADTAVAELPRGVAIDAVHDWGAIVAVRAQSRWLGWPAALEPTLLTWVKDHQKATRHGALASTRAIAERFDAIVRGQVVARQSAVKRGGALADVTAELMTATVEDPAAVGGRRLLTEAETVSVLRNWTAGDLGSLALALGVIVHYLAARPELQAELRRGVGDARALDRAIDEILRIDDPFVLNRRVTAHELELGGRRLPQGTRVVLNWTAANRDPAVFGDPDAFRPGENAEQNLVYGIGPHACPGRALATHELREALTAMLRATTAIRLAPGDQAVRETPPLGGYARVPVILA